MSAPDERRWVAWMCANERKQKRFDAADSYARRANAPTAAERRTADVAQYRAAAIEMRRLRLDDMAAKYDALAAKFEAEPLFAWPTGYDRKTAERAALSSCPNMPVGDAPDAFLAGMLDGARRDTLLNDLVKAGNTAERAASYHATGRADEAMFPSVRWPEGFDRAKAIEVLEAAELRPGARRGSMYRSLAEASDTWLVGALNRLLVADWTNEKLTAAMTDLGYVTDGTHWRHSLTTPRTDSPDVTVTDVDRRQAKLRLQWRLGSDDPYEQRVLDAEAKRIAAKRARK